MGTKLIITKFNEMTISSTFEGNDMVQVYANVGEETILGNIYNGKVKNIVKNINAAFLEIENGKMCYLSLNEVYNPLFLNPKKNSNINVGDELLIQITKEDIKTKVPVATTNLNFTGKYVVLVHGKPGIGISSKIPDVKLRKQLKQIVQPYNNDIYGLIVRTNAAYVTKELIEEEINTLEGIYKEVKERGSHKTAFSLVSSAPAGYLCDIRDSLSISTDEILTDNSEIYEEILDYLKTYQKEDLSKLIFFQDKLISLSNLYGIKTKLENALRKKVWLKSGGSIIIEPTEALTVIDVNTGKAISGKKQPKDTFLKINLEAAIEIAKQIRLRNLSGILIIDFIDMEEEDSKLKLMKELEELFKRDPVKTILVDMTALNLVEVTRKKVRKPLHEQINSKML
ncbi:MAG: hypothetical protein K0S61_504 [Anaerocolumna sp.]|jgi:ribonuclease G|nr:hypothetical protein [Anaerocolumna sp.]